jgi:UDP-glucose 4-epimerase
MNNVFKAYRKKKILIVGSHGFIGSHISSHLKNLGAHITTLSYTENTFSIEKVIKKHFDIIFNCSGYSGEMQCEEHPLMCIRGNFTFTYNILEAVKKHSTKTKLVIIGSRLEYGKPIYLPVDEKHPTTPLGIYGLSKLAISTIAVQYSRTFHIPITVVRVSNVYGPHMNQGNQNYNIVNNFIDRARKKQSITIFGNGTQRRDYLYISDLIDVLLRAGISKRANGTLYNIGYGKPIMFKDMVKEINSKFPTNIIHSKWPERVKYYETGDYISDISKAKKDLGWRPKISFQDGIEIMSK